MVSRSGLEASPILHVMFDDSGKYLYTASQVPFVSLVVRAEKNSNFLKLLFSSFLKIRNLISH